MPETKKNALLMFSKPPLPGLVKTRLTKEHGGPFTSEESAQFFNCMLFDVLEVCCQALDRLEAKNAEDRAQNPELPIQTYDIFISTAPENAVEEMKELFAKSGTWPREFHYLHDEGATFDDHFDDAFNQIYELGYNTVLSVGGDIPLMPREHIIAGYEWLHYFDATYKNGGTVLAPCQACGTSLVGFTRNNGMNHQGIYYNMSGRPALQGYLDKAEGHDMHIALLDAVPDVDNGEDLAHAMTVMNALDFCKHDQDSFVPWRSLRWVRGRGMSVTTPPNDDFDSRETLDK